ncbi:MAG: acyltransferase [Gammaproteobacteria bacterium]
MALDVGAHVLGQTREPLVLESAADNREVAIALCGQARRTLDLSSRHLDPLVYDTLEFVAAAKAFALRSRFSRLRIIVMDPATPVARGHRLIALAQALSSFVELRVPGHDYRDFNEAMLIADDQGYIHRPLADRYEGTADFHEPTGAGELRRRFDRVWDAGEPDPNFRRLSL